MDTQTQKALFKNILLNPYDDAPKLIYADWLEENSEDYKCLRCDGKGTYKEGHEYFGGWECYEVCKGARIIKNNNSEHARLIRFQFDNPDGDINKHFSRDLIKSLVPSQLDNCDVTFTKGFVTKVTLYLNCFMKHAQDIVFESPIQEWNFYDLKPWYGGSTYYWWEEVEDLKDIKSTSHIHKDVPPELFKLLDNKEVKFTRHPIKNSLLICYSYIYNEDAVTDMRAACYKYSRMKLLNQS